MSKEITAKDIEEFLGGDMLKKMVESERQKEYSEREHRKEEAGKKVRTGVRVQHAIESPDSPLPMYHMQIEEGSTYDETDSLRKAFDEQSSLGSSCKKCKSIFEVGVYKREKKDFETISEASSPTIVPSTVITSKLAKIILPNDKIIPDSNFARLWTRRDAGKFVSHEGILNEDSAHAPNAVSSDLLKCSPLDLQKMGYSPQAIAKILTDFKKLGNREYGITFQDMIALLEKPEYKAEVLRRQLLNFFFETHIGFDIKADKLTGEYEPFATWHGQGDRYSGLIHDNYHASKTNPHSAKTRANEQDEIKRVLESDKSLRPTLEEFQENLTKIDIKSFRDGLRSDRVIDYMHELGMFHDKGRGGCLKRGEIFEYSGRGGYDFARRDYSETAEEQKQMANNFTTRIGKQINTINQL